MALDSENYSNKEKRRIISNYVNDSIESNGGNSFNKEKYNKYFTIDDYQAGGIFEGADRSNIKRENDGMASDTETKEYLYELYRDRDYEDPVDLNTSKEDVTVDSVVYDQDVEKLEIALSNQTRFKNLQELKDAADLHITLNGSDLSKLEQMQKFLLEYNLNDSTYPGLNSIMAQWFEKN
ncbi:MAG: hypothetical protein V4691_03905 [Pseudomonadota bacterium]